MEALGCLMQRAHKKHHYRHNTEQQQLRKDTIRLRKDTIRLTHKDKSKNHT